MVIASLERNNYKENELKWKEIHSRIEPFRFDQTFWF